MSADSSESSQSGPKSDGPRFDQVLRIGTAVVLVVLLGVTSAILGVVVKQDSSAPEDGQALQEVVSTTTTVEGTAASSATVTTLSASEIASDEPVEVPLVVWMQETQARAVLSAAGLGCETKYQPGSQQDWGVVCGQDPENGMVPVGTVVTINVIAQGVEVPDVVGQGKDEATVSLAMHGLGATYVYQTTTDSAKWGKVLDQWVYGGMLVLPGGTVELTIGKKPFSMPTTTTLIKITIPSTPLSLP